MPDVVATRDPVLIQAVTADACAPGSTDTGGVGFAAAAPEHFVRAKPALCFKGTLRRRPLSLHQNVIASAGGLPLVNPFAISRRGETILPGPDTGRACATPLIERPRTRLSPSGSPLTRMLSSHSRAKSRCIRGDQRDITSRSRADDAAPCPCASPRHLCRLAAPNRREKLGRSPLVTLEHRRLHGLSAALISPKSAHVSDAQNISRIDTRSTRTRISHSVEVIAPPAIGDILVRHHAYV